MRCTECAVSLLPVPATTLARPPDLAHREAVEGELLLVVQRRGLARRPRHDQAVGAVVHEVVRESCRGRLVHPEVRVEGRGHGGQDGAEHSGEYRPGLGAIRFTYWVCPQTTQILSGTAWVLLDFTITCHVRGMPPPSATIWPPMISPSLLLPRAAVPPVAMPLLLQVLKPDDGLTGGAGHGAVEQSRP